MNKVYRIVSADQVYGWRKKLPLILPRTPFDVKEGVLGEVVSEGRCLDCGERIILSEVLVEGRYSGQYRTECC